MINEIFELTNLEFKAIRKATIYSQLPVSIQTFFEHNKFIINDDALVIKEPNDEEIDRWNLIDKSEKDLLQIFFIEVTLYEKENEQEDDEGENYTVTISCQTPTWSNNTYDYPIFRVGLPLLEKRYITGKERKKLKNERQRTKWDYFFQASKKRLTHQHDTLISKFNKNSQVYHEQGNLFIYSFYFSLAFSFLLLDLYSCTFSLILFFVACLSIWKFTKSISYKKKFRNAVQIIEEEKNNLVNQINWLPLTVTEMEEWLEEELLELDGKAIKALKFSKKKIVRRNLTKTEEVNFVDKDVLGLKIQEYGFTQPLETNGKRWIEKKYPRHLEAYTYHPNSPLVGVYYIHLIYMTPDSIGYSRFFYDFILAKPEGEITKQYYYKDIVSIGTKVTATEVFSDLEEWETKILKFSLSNPEVIEMGLTDKIAIENIRKIVDTRKEMEAEELSDEILESDTPDLDELLNTPSGELPGTKVRFIEETVKTYWSQKKKG